MRKALVLVAAVLVFCACAALLAQTAEGNGPFAVDQKTPMPKTEIGTLGYTAGPVTFEEVVIRNAPDDEDLEKAKSDPSDKCHPKLAVGMSNSGSRKMKVKIYLRLEDKDGNVYMTCDRTDTVQPGAKNDHTNFCWLDSMKTLDWPKVAFVHITASISAEK